MCARSESFIAAIYRGTRIRRCTGSKSDIPLASAIAALGYAGHEVLSKHTTKRVGKLGELLKYDSGLSLATCHEFLYGFVTSAMSRIRATDVGNQVDHTSHAITNWLVRLTPNLQPPTDSPIAVRRAY